MTARYKLIPIVLLTLSCLSNANTTHDEIASTKAKIQALQASLQELEASLPEKIEEKKAVQDAEITKKNALVTHAEFSFANTTGNTDTLTYGLDLNMKKRFDEHIFEFSLDTQYADDNGVETKNKLLSELTYDYQLTDRFAFSYLLGYKADKFSGYDYQIYTGPGVKYKLIKEEDHDLAIEGNILYSKDDIENGATRNYSSFRTKVVYEWQILQNLKFTQDLSYRTEIEDTSNYFVFSKTAFVSKISDIFSFGLNYKIDHVSNPPQNKEHTDKTLSASLIIDY